MVFTYIALYAVSSGNIVSNSDFQAIPMGQRIMIDDVAGYAFEVSNLTLSHELRSLSKESCPDAAASASQCDELKDARWH